jgi:prophage DNA circulation protein
MDVLMPKMSDELFFAAANARAAFIAAMQAQVLETDTINVATALPAVVLAYAHGLSEAALIERNSVRHPLFVKGRLNV